MSRKSGLSVSQKQLSAAVRKALFTSATVTSVALMTPQTLAENLPSQPSAQPSAQAVAQSAAQQTTAASTNDDVVSDLTVVSQSGTSDCNGSSCEQTQSDDEGINEIRITNDSDLVRGNASVELTGSIYTTEGVVDRQDANGNNNQSADTIVGIGSAWTQENYDTAEDEDANRFPDSETMMIDFSGEDILEPDNENAWQRLQELLVENGFEGEILDYRGEELTEERFELIFDTLGESFSVNIAEEDSAIITDASGILASSESGDIVIRNTGDIEVGSGERKEYWTDVNTHTIYSSMGYVQRNDQNYSISLNGNWIDEGDGKRLDATAYAAGIKAESVSGNIRITNSGNVASVIRDENGDALGFGEVSAGIEAKTSLGNIDISNTGNISVGEGSAGITAKAKQAYSDIIITDGGEDGVVVSGDFSDTLSFEYENGSNSYSVEREYTAVTPAYYKLDEDNQFIYEDGEKVIDQPKIVMNYKYSYADVYLKNIDGTNSTISITNGELDGDSATINIHGNNSFGILAENPSGESIDITNHGDINFISDGAELTSGVGIFADTTAYNRDVNRQIDMADGLCATLGETTYVTANGGCLIVSGEKLDNTEVIDGTNVNLWTEMELVRHFEATSFFGDGGDIEITNSGDIDISAIKGDLFGSAVSAIHASGYGNTTIHNTGNLTVGENSRGISVYHPGETEVINEDNTISLSGSGAVGIFVSSMTVPLATSDMSLSELEMYGGGLTGFINENYGTFHNGDTNVSNSGDIIAADAGHTYTLDDQGRITGEYNESGLLVPAGIADRQIGMSVSAVNSNNRGTDMPWNVYGQDAIDHFNENGSSLADADPDVEFYDINVVNSGDISLGKAGVGVQVAGVYGEAFLTNNEDGVIDIDDSLVFATASEDGFVVEQSVGVFMRPAGQSWTDNRFINDGSIDVGKAGIGADIFSGFGSSYGVNNGDITVDDGIVITRMEGTEDEGVARVSSTGMRVRVDGGFNGYAKGTNHGTINTGDDSYGMVVTNRSTGWTSTIVPELITTFDQLDEASQAQLDVDLMRQSNVYTATAINGEGGIITTGDDSVGMAVGGIYNYANNFGKIYIGEGGDAYNFNTITYFEIAEQNELIEAGVEIAAEDLIQQETRGAGMKSVIDSLSNFSVLVNRNEISSEYFDENGDKQFFDNNIGVYAQSTGFGIAVNTGGITLGDNSVGLRGVGASAGQAQNTGEIVVGDNSVGAHAKAFASATAVNQAFITTGDNGIGLKSEGLYASAYNIYKITGENNAETGSAVGIEVAGTSAFAMNSYSFSTIDMGENSTAIHVTAESREASVVLADQGLWAIVNDETGEAIELVDSIVLDGFADWAEANPDLIDEGYTHGAKLISVLDEDGNEILRQQEEYVYDENGEVVINEETGHPLTQPSFDEDGNPIMLVKQEQAVNEDGEKLDYVLRQAQQINVTSGSISTGTAINGGTVIGNRGLVIDGENTEAYVEALDMFEIVDGEVQNVEFYHGAFGSVLVAQNTGTITATEVAIDINDATNAQVVNTGVIDAPIGIEVDITAVKEHTRSQLATKPAVDEDGNPIVLPWYDYSSPVVDENGEYVLDDDGQIQYEIEVDSSGDPIYLQGTQGEFSKMVDEHGNYVYEFYSGGHLYQQNIEEIEVDAAIHSAYILNTGEINAEQGIVITANDAGATFVDDQVGAVIVNNAGTINAEDSIVIISESGDVNSTITNSGLINGNVITTDGDDYFYNGLNSYGTAAGQIQLSSSTLDFKGGKNQLLNRFGDITFEGRSRIKLGSFEETYFGTKEVEVDIAGQTVIQVVEDLDNELTRKVNGAFTNESSTASYITISSVNNRAKDVLVVEGDMNLFTSGSNSGLITLETSMTGSDRIVIEGDLTAAQSDGVGNISLDENGEIAYLHDINLNIAPASQQKGDQALILLSHDEDDKAAITVKGEANYDEVVVQSIVGDFADTVVSAEVVENDAGQQVLEITYGLADVGVAASSLSHMAANYWFESVGKHNDRRANAERGFSGFVNSFHTDSDVHVEGEVAKQDIGFSQRISGMQAGVNYQSEQWAFSAYVGKGNANASSAEPTQSQSSMKFNSFGMTAGYRLDQMYIDAVLQTSNFDADADAYNHFGETSGTVTGASIEAGFGFSLDSGYNLVPQLQVSAVEAELDNISTLSKVSEDKDDTYRFVFDNDTAIQTRLGVSVNRTFDLEYGYAMPFATLSVVNTQAKNTLKSNAVPFLSDMTGTGYAIDAGVNSRFKSWTVNGQVSIYDGEVNSDGLSLQLNVSYKW